MQSHEAGRFIAQYLKYFPNELDRQDTSIYDNFKQPKQITFLAAPTEHIQARYVSTWVRQAGRYLDGRRTAIVLCNENLLPTVIHSLPAEVEKVNVTTGYPFCQTPVASFIQSYYDMVAGGHMPRLVRAFQRHPYHKYLEDSEHATLPDMLRQIARAGSSDPLFQESLFRAYTLINRLNALVESGDLNVTDATMQRLVNQLIQQTSIPFHGEPAEGLQVMGVLETRNLDFDHVLLLSCNDGNMPKGVNDSSFIPHSIRHAYELTTIENKVSIYAYYFHRLLQRAKDVTILWNNSTEDGQRGEMSRFMLQLLVESGHSITQRTLQSEKLISRHTPQPISKTPHVMKVLWQQLEEKSPTFPTTSRSWTTASSATSSTKPPTLSITSCRAMSPKKSCSSYKRIRQPSSGPSTRLSAWNGPKPSRVDYTSSTARSSSATCANSSRLTYGWRRLPFSDWSVTLSVPSPLTSRL